MTTSLDDLRAVSQLRTATALQSQYTSQTINPPTWTSLTGVTGGLQVSLSAPMQDNGQAYLPTSAGITYPATSDNLPVFFYQVQLDTSSNFVDPVLYDLGTSTSQTITGVSGTFYARARARTNNGIFSDWRPKGAAVATLSTLLNAAIKQDTSSDTQASSTYATINATSGDFSVTITTTGGSVLLLFQLSHNMVAPGQTFFRFVRGSTSLGYGVNDSNATTQAVGGGGTYSVSMSTLDAVAAGTYTYHAQWSQIGGGTAFAQQGALQAIELKAR